MKPIFGWQFGAFPIYGLMIIIGCFVGMLVFNGIMKRAPLSKYVKRRVRGSLFLGALGGLLASNLAHWVVFEEVRELPVAQRFTQGGFSVYFGVLGCLAVSALLLRLHRVRVRENLGLVLTPLIISQMIWRVGCALRGCCFGIGDEFTVPVRLLEMLGLLGLAIFLRARRTKEQRVTVYLFGYSALRFVLEFLRGDDRGSLLGIEFLTPTQLAALTVVLISGGCLFIRPIIRGCGAEEWLDAKLSAVRGIFRKKDKEPYQPLPQDYVETERKKQPLRVVAIIAAIAILITTLFAAWNPLSWSLFDGFSEAVRNWLYAERGQDDPIGHSNGTSIIDVSDAGKIENAAAALQLVMSYDTFADVTLAPVKTQGNHNRIYTFAQTVNGQQVMGTECALVTDYEGNAQYIVSDAADRAYLQTVQYSKARTAAADVSYEGYTALGSKTYLYNTGEQLVESVVTRFSKNGSTVDFGAAIDKTSGMLLSMTDDQGKVSHTLDRMCIISASSSVKVALNDQAKIKSLSKQSVKGDGYSYKYDLMTRALASAYLKSNLSAEDFGAILDNSKAVVLEMSTVSVDTFCDIFVAETLSYLRYNGNSDEYARAVADKIEHTFERKGIKQKDDQVTTAITARERKSTFRYQMDYLGDRDVYVINGVAGQSTQITFISSTPIRVEISLLDGQTCVSFSVDGTESITFAPEDGDQFVVRVIDQRNNDEKDKASDYKIAVISIPEKDTQSVFANFYLNQFEQAYNTRNLAQFTAFITNEAGEPFAGWEILVAGVSAPVMDACSKGCGGEEDGYDLVKEQILRYLIIDYPDALRVTEDGERTVEDVLHDTKLELNYVDAKAVGDTIHVKASVGIYMDGFYLYEGYTFLQLQVLKYDVPEFESKLEEGASDEEKEFEKIEWMLTEFRRDGYYVTAFNTDEIAATFGDTLADQKNTSELASLYLLWETYTKQEDCLSIKLHRLDAEEALADGHSEEQVRGFQEFIYRKNLADLQELRADIEHALKNCRETIATYDFIFFAVDCCTGKWYFAVLGKALEVCDAELLEPFGKAVTGNFEGAMEDIAKNELTGSVTEWEKETAKLLEKQLEIVDGWIEEYQNSNFFG